MRDTKIMISGMPAMVEAAHASYFLKKETLIEEANALQKAIGTNSQVTEIALKLNKIMGKIIRLNRTMKRKGMYCDFVK